MGRGIKEEARAQELEPVSLSELIYQHVRAAIETAVHEELRAALGTSPYERRDVRWGYRNGVRERTLTGPTGPVALTLTLGCRREGRRGADLADFEPQGDG
jgi:transposase-like protein